MTVLSRFIAYTRRRPIIRGMLSYAAIWPTSCIIQQTIAGKTWENYDWKQALRFCLYGSLCTAPTLYAWAFVEQLTYGPVAMAGFFFIMNYAKTYSVEKATDEVKHKFWPTYKGYDGLDMHENFTPDFINIGQYATDLFTERATKLINEHEYVSNPLFLFISHLAPHTGELNITTGDTFLEERNSDEMNEKFGYIGDINRRRYVDIVKSADDSLGEIMKALLDKGVMDNTMILFMSDNGGQTFGMHENFASNWPLRGVPYIYEGIYDGYYGVTGRESENPVYNISAVLLSPTNEALSYYRDCRNTLPTDLSCSPCLFDLKNDPCESGNIAEEESDIVNYLSYKVDQFWNELVPQQNKPFDVNSDPAKFGYVWSPWLDDVPEKRIQLIHSNYKIYV